MLLGRPQQNRIQRRGEESKRVGSSEEGTTTTTGRRKERPAGWRRARGKEVKEKRKPRKGGWLLAVTKGETREKKPKMLQMQPTLQETMGYGSLQVVGLAISFFSDTIVTNSRSFSISLPRCLALTCFTLSSLRQYLINEISRQR